MPSALARGYPTRGSIALELTGMPASHAACFQHVADETRCVISSRSVGRYATGLLLENYATKGFHSKAKTCNWGPMAGFVLSDPRFTKRGASREPREAQRTDVFHALASGGTETPLFITDERRRALAHEDPDLGNITPRIRAIKERLNQRIQAEAGYRGGDCVHHSDEAGRPFPRSSTP